MLILKRDDPDLFERTIGKFESHWSIREQQPEVGNLLKYITAFIRSRLGLGWVSSEEVQHVFGVLKTNGVGGGKACYLYPNLSLMSHSCLANTEIKSSPAKEITLVALTHIRRGEELTWSYSNILLPRDQRQSHLESTWLFSCSCPRCSDQEELGLNYSAQQCSCGGHFSLNRGQDLACTSCHQTINRREAARAEDNILKTISQLESSGAHAFLCQLSDNPRYHKTHHVYVRASIRCD